MAARGQTDPSSKQPSKPGDTLLVIHEFTARSPDEISLTKGDRVELIEKDDDFGDGWYLGRHLKTGTTGLFPEIYTLLAPVVANPKPSSQATRNPPPPIATTSASSTALAAQAAKRAPIIAPSQASAGSADPAKPQTSPALVSPTLYPPYSSAPPTQPLPQIPSPNSPASSSTRSPAHSSSVMNEMHNVINEHITDLNKPGSHTSNLHPLEESRVPSASGSGSTYSRDYIAGEETDEEEVDTANGQLLTGQVVREWSPAQIASYLESQGVEKAHCDLFRDEEFTGEVILAMEQSQVFMKELDLGPIGRRMRTWQHIKTLQDEVKTAETPRSSHVEPPVGSRIRSAGYGTNQDNSRPSAATIRSLGQRRHSSTDKTLNRSTRTSSQPPQYTRSKNQSFDRNWTMDNSISVSPSSSSRSRPTSTVHLTTMSTDRPQLGQSSTASSQFSLVPGADRPEADREYLSSAEAEAKRTRNVLRKRENSDYSKDHKRISSAGSDNRRISRGFFWQRSRDHSPAKKPVEATPTAKRNSQRDGIRVVSEPTHGQQGSPTVTKLEYDTDTSEVGNRHSSGSKMTATEAQRASTHPDTTDHVTMRGGFRAISDAVTGREKSLLLSPPEGRLLEGDSYTQSPADSTNSPSFGVEDANKSEFSTPAQGLVTSGTRRKAKQQTSAYTRGLEKKSPNEQRVGADYSGWMKKKSSNLMTTWKPRYFVLKGRRLSYYYSENDTEEKGLIDISNHRVLPADHDFFTGIHATLTGASTGSPITDDTNGSTKNSPSTSGGSPYTSGPTNFNNRDAKDPNLFIFKLVPPRSGLSKGVNFTKPSVHYFALPSRAEGRLWMAALMKSTIDRDETQKVVTTYQQKTISLEQARARREMPPFLKGVEEEPQGLGIQTRPGAQEDDDSSIGSPRIRGGPGGDIVSYGADDNSSTRSKPATTATYSSSAMPESQRDSLAGTSIHDMASEPSSFGASTPEPASVPPPSNTSAYGQAPAPYSSPSLETTQRQGPAGIPHIMTNLQDTTLSYPPTAASTTSPQQSSGVHMPAHMDKEIAALPSNHSSSTLPSAGEEAMSPLEKVSSASSGRDKSFSFTRRDSSNTTAGMRSTVRSSRTSTGRSSRRSSRRRTSSEVGAPILKGDDNDMLDKLRGAGMW